MLKNCYSNSLKISDSIGAKTIAFPSISTGIYGVNHEKAKPLIKKALEENNDLENVKEIIFVFLDEKTKEFYES